MNKKDGNLVSQAALDAIASAEERIEGAPELVGVQVTLLLKTPRGIRIINCIKEKGA